MCNVVYKYEIAANKVKIFVKRIFSIVKRYFLILSPARACALCVCLCEGHKCCDSKEENGGKKGLLVLHVNKSLRAREINTSRREMHIHII